LNGDWRWLLDRSDSPWYPTVRLYRQHAIGDWASALGEVKADLEAFAGRHHHTTAISADSPSQRIQTTFPQALGLHQQGQLAQAKAAYEQILVGQPDHFDCLHLLGVIAFQTHDHSRAIELINKAIELYPGNADFHSNLGNAQQALKQFSAAIASYDKAIALKPDFADAHSNRGAALKELGQLEAAIAGFDRAIAINPDFARAWSNRGNAQKELGQFAAAAASYEKVIALQPDHAEACLNRGIALQATKQFEAAIASYDQAIAIKPDFAEAWSNRGVALKDLRQLESALASIDQAIAIRPDFADAHSNRGNTLQDLKQLEAAIASYDKAIAIQPDFAAAWSNRGTALQALNRMDAAIASFDKAVAIEPDYAEAWFNRGVALKECQRLNEAITSYDRAIAVRPGYSNANYNKAAALLLNGDLTQGWPMHEWRWKCESLGLTARNYSKSLWLGEAPLKGKHILLHSEQGFGDTIQFCRYAKLVCDLGATVTMEVPPALTGLLQGLEGVSQLVAEGFAPSDFDTHCPLLSLPLAFKTDLDSIPASRAYLFSDASKVSHWSKVLGTKTKPRIGLVWSGNTRHTNDANRSIALSALIPHLPNSFDYMSLQKEVRDKDQAALANHSNIRFLGDQIRDFSDTAALCELMDIVISVDTSVAHLSGALGKTTWILLPFRPDWRWLLNRSDSPWYPTVRLYRQHVMGDWTGALSTLRADLEAGIDLG
jgi:tetratricopeptide (TPR) repeat protein